MQNCRLQWARNIFFYLSLAAHEHSYSNRNNEIAIWLVTMGVTTAQNPNWVHKLASVVNSAAHFGRSNPSRFIKMNQELATTSSKIHFIFWIQVNGEKMDNFFAYVYINKEENNAFDGLDSLFFLRHHHHRIKFIDCFMDAITLNDWLASRFSMVKH